MLDDLPIEHTLPGFSSLDYDQSSVLKVLGLKWYPWKDCFTFDVKPMNRTCTKGTILSELAFIYDPLDFLSPLTFLSKCFIQRLWILNIDWDATPSHEIVKQWKHYTEQFYLLGSLEIHRCIFTEGITNCEIHSFSDSSEVGYSAVVRIVACCRKFKNSYNHIILMPISFV